MHSSIHIICTIVVSFLCTALVAQNFEGTITMQKHSEAQYSIQQEVVFTIKDERILIELNSINGPVRVIKDLEAGTTTSLFQNKGKKYAFTQQDESKVAEDEDPRHTMLMELMQKQVIFEVTSDQRQIGDFLCTKVLAENHQVQIEAWITQDVNVSLIEYFPYEQSESAAELDIQKMIWEAGFVVEFWTKSKDTEEVNKLTFTPERSVVDSNVFTHDPSEYALYDKNALNTLYKEASTDQVKMDELKEVLEAFQAK